MAELTRLGKYEIWRELGRGAMGVVYEAFDPLIRRSVAIKTILKSSFDKSEAQEAFGRFRREAQAAGRLSHPKIVSIYEYGEDEEMAYIVMELIRGKELKEYFDREERFEARAGIRIVLQLLDALDYSHSRGVVHRDIKPANILITEDGQVKVADFGIAKIESTHLTQVGIVLGTPSYMSPEQFMGKSVDRRTDIYSAGVVLYQSLTGMRPFTGSVISIMHKAVSQEAVPPSQLNPALTKSVDEVVRKAMAKRPEDRYQTATEFMKALKLAADTLPSGAPGKPLIAADEMFGASDSTIAAQGNEAHAREKAAAEARAEAESRSRKEAAEKARLARKIAEIKSEAAEARAGAEARRKQAAEAQARRARELAGVMAEKERKLADAIAEREAEREIQHKLEAEARQELETRIKRKREAEEEQARSEKEIAEARAQAGAAAKRKLAAEDLLRRESERAEAEARDETVKRGQEEAAEQARRARARVIAISAGAAVAIAAAAIWYALRASA